MSDIFLIAIALSIDSCSVCVANCSKNKQVAFKYVLLISFLFGFFQFFMPILGYFFGVSFANLVAKYQHFIVAFIFFGLAVMQINDNDEESKVLNSFKSLILAAIATSIDALVIGVVFGLSNEDIYVNSAIIGIVCFILCVIACYLGKIIGHILDKKAVILSALILFCLGLKALISHYF